NQFAVTQLGVTQHGVNRSRAGTAVQSPNAGRGTVDDAREFGAKFRRAVFDQTLLRFFRGKPGGVSIRFLRRFEPSHFAKVGGHGKHWLGRSGRRPRVFFRTASFTLATEVVGEG